MPATASHSGQPEFSQHSHVVQTDQFDGVESSSSASSALSLSMMRRAFDGLRRNTDRSLSLSTEQGNEIERSEDFTRHRERVPNAFKEETYTYHAVVESTTSTASPASDFRDSRATRSGKAQTASIEFFDYLTAIGGA